MKKVIVTSIVLFFVCLPVFSIEETDSLKQINLNEIIVAATRVSKNTPIAYSNLSANIITVPLKSKIVL